MDVRRITINIAGRVYPLNVPAAEEETLRKVGKQIENMIKDFEQNFDVRDKQDALAMCALKLGTNAEVVSARSEEHTSELQSRENLVCRLLLEKKKTEEKQQAAEE